MKNYTSEVPVDQTVARIEKVLVKHNATHIAKGYQNGEVASLSFTIMDPASRKPVRVNLPANPSAVFKVLMGDRNLTEAGIARVERQARRTAWKIMQDLVEVQLSMVEMAQAEFVQIFLPYIVVGGQTFYESLKEGGFKLLGPAKEES